VQVRVHLATPSGELALVSKRTHLSCLPSAVASAGAHGCTRSGAGPTPVAVHSLRVCVFVCVHVQVQVRMAAPLAEPALQPWLW
jgi:hypothetical protein